MEDLERHCSCIVCFETFDALRHSPRTLSCGHSICVTCIEQLRERSRLLKCPTCNQLNAHENLCCNYAILGLADSLRQKRSQNMHYSIRSNDTKPCTSCKKQIAKEDLCVCVTCETKERMCSKCAVENHSRHTLMLEERYTHYIGAEEAVRVLREKIDFVKHSSQDTTSRLCSLLVKMNKQNAGLGVPHLMIEEMCVSPDEIRRSAIEYSTALDDGPLALLKVLQNATETIEQRMNQPELQPIMGVPASSSYMPLFLQKLVQLFY